MKMIIEFAKFKNEPPISTLSVSYQWFLGHTILKKINWNIVSDIVLLKEKEILHENTELISDGYTGLGSNSLTSRFKTFNVLTWHNTEIEKIHQGIKHLHDEFIDILPFEKYKGKLWIQCWANVLRKGEEIKPHNHASGPYSYLSGHITVQCKDTKTIYINPNRDNINKDAREEYSIDNVPGRISMFQSDIMHYTSVHKDDKERITIAFDIFVDEHTPLLLKERFIIPL